MVETTCSHLQLQFVPTVSERPCTTRTRSFLWECMNVSFSKSGKEEHLFACIADSAVMKHQREFYQPGHLCVSSLAAKAEPALLEGSP